MWKTRNNKTNPNPNCVFSLPSVQALLPVNVIVLKPAWLAAMLQLQ